MQCMEAALVQKMVAEKCIEIFTIIEIQTSHARMRGLAQEVAVSANYIARRRALLCTPLGM
jgi:hypothetical protein